MSLICGIISPGNAGLASPDNLRAMMRQTGHRARDGEAQFFDLEAGVALGFQYTATFGQDRATLPWHEDGAIVAAVDGDICGSDISHSEPDQPGRAASIGAAITAFRSAPEAFPAGLDGHFALFLWDRERKEFHLSAGPLANKLVYYAELTSPSALIFSTELKAVLAHPAVDRKLDHRALPQYLARGQVAAPFTLADGVRKLLAAEHLRFSSGGSERRRYWLPASVQGSGDFAHWAERTGVELASAVSRTIGNARRVGVYLSGGADSSAVLAALRRLDGVEARAFTLAYTGHRSEYDMSWARDVARAAATPHEVLEVRAEEEVTPEVISELFQQIDEPFRAANRTVNEHVLGKAAREAGFDSILTGGASVMFASGYLRQIGREQINASRENAMRMARPPRMQADRMEKALVRKPDTSLIDKANFANIDLVARLDNTQAGWAAHTARMGTSGVTLFSSFIPPLLGIDARTPFLDAKLLSFALSVPGEFKGLDAAEFDQSLLRACVKQDLGIDLSLREKRAYPATPSAKWLDTASIECLRPLVDDGIMKESYLQRLKSGWQDGRKSVRNEAWLWFVFSCWYQFQIKQVDPFEHI